MSWKTQNQQKPKRLTHQIVVPMRYGISTIILDGDASIEQKRLSFLSKRYRNFLKRHPEYSYPRMEMSLKAGSHLLKL